MQRPLGEKRLAATGMEQNQEEHQWEFNCPHLKKQNLVSILLAYVVSFFFYLAWKIRIKYGHNSIEHPLKDDLNLANMTLQFISAGIKTSFECK